MEFKGQYLKFNEYKSLGGTLEEMPFNLLEYNARKKIDERTFGRLIEKGNQYQEVKLCIFDMISIIEGYNFYRTQNKSISSESTDGYSVSYATPSESYIKTEERELNTEIDSYLANLIIDNIPVLYRGTDDN